MSESNPQTLDVVFRDYDSQQAAAYAANRGSYPPDFNGVILKHFESSGGHFNTLLDVGCGTGQVTRTFSAYFDHAIGTDHSQQMISQACLEGGQTKAGNQIQYEVGNAEELEALYAVKPGSVDLLTAGMAVHWFKLDQFWKSVNGVVKPGGMVAVWTYSSLYCHPSTPNAKAVQAVLSHLEDDILGPYETPGNKLSRDMYDNLALPWQIDPPIATFPRSGFVRYEWNRNGTLEEGKADFFGGSDSCTLGELAEGLGTASMVTRWREANSELVGTEKDCVKMTVKNIALAMGLNEEDAERQVIRTGNSTTLLMFTKDIK